MAGRLETWPYADAHLCMLGVTAVLHAWATVTMYVGLCIPKPAYRYMVWSDSNHFAIYDLGFLPHGFLYSSKSSTIAEMNSARIMNSNFLGETSILEYNCPGLFKKQQIFTPVERKMSRFAKINNTAIKLPSVPLTVWILEHWQIFHAGLLKQGAFDWGNNDMEGEP